MAEIDFMGVCFPKSSPGQKAASKTDVSSVLFGLTSPRRLILGRSRLPAKYPLLLTCYIMGWETHLQIAIAAATNLTLLPAIFYAYRRKQSFVFIISVMTLICSIGYHTADAWENPPPGP